MDTKTEILTIIISSLLSGIIGVAVSIFYHRKYENRKIKIDTLKNLAAYRYNLRGEEFTKTLNEIFIVFQDSGEVLDALKKFYEILVTGQSPLANNQLIKLFRAMCKNLKIKTKYEDSIFLQVFNLKE